MSIILVRAIAIANSSAVKIDEKQGSECEREQSGKIADAPTPASVLEPSV